METRKAGLFEKHNLPKEMFNPYQVNTDAAALKENCELCQIEECCPEHCCNVRSSSF